MKRLMRLFGRDDGAALVTVLLIVAIMAAGAALTFENLGFSVKRTTAERLYGQARFYALGGEQLAADAAGKVSKNNVRSFTEQAVSYPIDGGRIEGVLRDASNCFNLNSLVERRDGNALVANELGGLEYARLLGALGVADTRAEALVNALTDWLDSDTRSLPLGAEDYDYGMLNPPYRAANNLMADVSELFMVKGYDPEIITLLKPLVCAEGDTRAMVLNVNSLKVSEAPLLVALVGGDFGLAKASEVIATRTSRAYANVGDFWRERVFNGLTIDQSVRERTIVKPRRFESRIRVKFHEATSHMTSIIDIDTNGTAVIVGRRYGVLQ